MIVVLDTETTGLIENRTLRLDRQSEISEVCLLEGDLDSGESRIVVDALVRPRARITPEMTALNAITPEMVERAPSFSSLAHSIKAAAEGADAVVAHNASFDQEMIDIEMERIGLSVEWPRMVCTVEQTIHLLGRRLSLSDLHLHLFSEPFAGAHRAAADVAALWRCCVELRRRKLL